MQTLPLPRLAALLTASSAGWYATEAAAQLLIAHGMWLRRDDFLAACVEAWDTRGDDIGAPVWAGATADDLDDDSPQVAAAGVHWGAIGEFVDTAPCSGSEARILRLVAELAGYDTGVPLDELLSGLDDRNSRHVLAAIAHTLDVRPGVGQ